MKHKFLNLKKILIIAIVTLLSLGTAIAMHHRQCMHPMQILVQGVDLTTEQQEMLRDFKEQRHEYREEHMSMKMAKMQWISSYLEGTLSREQVLASLGQAEQDHIAWKQEKHQKILALLATYSDVQKQQVLHNLDTQEACLNDADRDSQEDRKGHHGKHDGEFGEDGPRHDKLFHDVHLTDEQQGLLDTMRTERRLFFQLMKEQDTTIMDGKMEKVSMLRGYLEGTSTEFATQSNPEVLAQRHAFRDAQAQRMMDLLDTLDDAQAAKVQANIENIQEYHHRPQKR